MKITFNKIAMMNLLEANWAKGLQVRLSKDGNQISFKPSVHKIGKDIIPLLFNTRGGAEATFDGASIDQVVQALRHPFQNPFFILKKINDWVVAERFEARNPDPRVRKIEPPRHLPHMRVWATSTAADKVYSYTVSSIRSILTELEQADSLIRAYGEVVHVGRPPEHIVAAKETMRLFEAAARAYLPVYKDLESMKEIIDRALTLPRGIANFDPTDGDPLAHTDESFFDAASQTEERTASNRFIQDDPMSPGKTSRNVVSIRSARQATNKKVPKVTENTGVLSMADFEIDYIDLNEKSRNDTGYRKGR